MQVDSEIQLQISDSLIELLATLASASKSEVLHTLYDMCSDPIAKVRDPKHKTTWSYKDIQYPKTPVKLRIKAKFRSGYNRNPKTGNIYCSFEFCQSRKKYYTEKDIVDQIAELYLLGAKLDA